MGVKKGMDRLSIALSVLVMIVFTSVIVVLGLNEGFSSLGNMLTVIAGAALICVLGTLFGIRAVAYVILWVVEGFKDEKRSEK
jgi:hypothetical protein